MHTKILESATAPGPRTVVLLELELEPVPGVRKTLYIVVIDLPPDSRGRAQHWCRTETKLAAATELYEQSLRDHVNPAAE